MVFWFLYFFFIIIAIVTESKSMSVCVCVEVCLYVVHGALVWESCPCCNPYPNEETHTIFILVF